MTGKVVAICIAPAAGIPMERVEAVEALAGGGLKGDRYADGRGSYNKGKTGHRQVTFINQAFFPGSGYDYTDTRRNIVTEGVELNRLIGLEFQIGEARFRGVKYCYPCDRPNKLAKARGLLGENVRPFQEAFHDRGGLLADVIEGGIIAVGDCVTVFLNES